MAQNNPFLKSPFDDIGLGDQEALLPGQQATRPPEQMPKVNAPPAQEEAVAPTPTPAQEPRRNNRPERWLPDDSTRQLFDTAAQKYDVPVNVLMALGHQESRYNSNAIGQETQWGRAKGMLQYLDSTAQNLGINPFDAAQSIDAAAKQIRERLDKGASMVDAVKEHFAGPNRKLWGQKTETYGREVMEKAYRIGGLAQEAAPQTTAATDTEIPADWIRLTPEQVTEIEARQANVQRVANPLEAPQPSEQGFLDRAGTAVQEGWGNTLSNLNTARFALGSDNSAEVAQEMAAKFARQAAAPKTAGQQEIDEAFQRVTDAKGAWDTTVAGFKALGTALVNPADLAVEIAGQAPNMVPTLGAGVVGAGGGAAIGAAAGAPAGGVGAIPGAITGGVIGGRAGMVAGTTATELGAEVEQLVANRLKADNKPATAENIKALLDNQSFRESARNQGLAKGLTVAAVDQLFLGLGGKVAGAAGRAATVPGKVGLGAAAVGTDAAGEVIGEAASQKVARGEVDAGDALREGVMSLGQSVVEPVAGAAMQGARRAAGQPAAPQVEAAVPAQPDAAVPPNPAPTAPAPAPAQPAGPMSRALEDAADQEAGQPNRVTVTAPNGEQASGQITGYQEDADGNFVAQIVGDDGQVITLDSRTGVQITPEATPDAGPMGAALTAAAEENAAITGQPAPVVEAAQEVPALAPEAAAVAPVQAAAPVAEEPVAPAAEPVIPSAPKPIEQQLATMDEPALQARLLYIADQARASGGWTKMFVDARNAVQREIRKRQKESPNARVDTSVAAPVAGDGRLAGGADVAAPRSAEPRRRARVAQPVSEQPAGAETAGVSAGPAVLRDGDPGVAEPALTDTHAGQQFDSELAAKQYIAQQKIGRTHQMIERRPGQFEIASKVKQEPRRQADKLAASDAKHARQEALVREAAEKAEQRKFANPDDEALYQHAVEFVTRTGNPKRPAIQNELKIGFDRATKYVDRMELEGIVSKAASDGARTVFPAAQQEPEFGSEAYWQARADEAQRKNQPAAPTQGERNEERQQALPTGPEESPEQASQEAAEADVLTDELAPEDDGADIPLAFMKKTKVPHEVWVQDENAYDTVEIPADQALASVREDIVNLRSLLDCLRS